MNVNVEITLIKLTQLFLGFFRYGEENRDAKLTKGNDISSSPLTLRWGLPFYNRKYWTIYVSIGYQRDIPK